MQPLSVVLAALSIFVVLVSVLIIAFWVHKRSRTSCLYLDDFKKLSAEVQELSTKTAEIREDVDQDNTAAECIKITNQELLNAADEWDKGNLIALAAWEDFIQVQENINQASQGSSVDLEKQHMQGDSMIKERKNHAQFMIKLMRAKVVEGIEQRKRLSVQLQRVHMAIKSRYLSNIAVKAPCTALNETNQEALETHMSKLHKPTVAFRVIRVPGVRRMEQR